MVLHEADLIVIVNETLNRLREEYGVSSDETLAREISNRIEPVSDAAIYRWRRGIYSEKAFRILVPQILAGHHIAP